MRYHETHFEEYLHSNKQFDLHPKLNKTYDKFPNSLASLKNVLLYGPPGSGKYTQALKIINKYSHTDLKYEKKMMVTFNKQTYFFKISDVHFEIDMSLLGCNSKLLWHEIYTQIVDIVSSRVDKHGIILCKYFHEIHNELLDNFYSYMQTNIAANYCRLTFVLVTEHYSFLPEKIINCCQTIYIPRPSKSSYLKCKKLNKNKPQIDFMHGTVFANAIDNVNAHENLIINPASNTNHQLDVSSIKNIKSLYDENANNNNNNNNNNNANEKTVKMIADKIIHCIKNKKTFQYLTFRDLLYDILVYNTDIYECVWYIYSTLVKEKWIPEEKINDTLTNTYDFLKHYNNNYRPIYHMEKYFLSFLL